MRRAPWPTTAALAVALSLTGCGSDPTDSSAPASSPAPSVTDTTPPAPPTDPATQPPSAAPVPAVLEFTGTTVDGAEFDATALAGRPVVLWFWAPWCAVCRSQAPMVAELAREYGDDVGFVGIGSLDSGSAIGGFADDAPGPTHLSDPEGALWKRFGISEQSSFVVLDAAGMEVLRTGYNDDGELRDTVDALAG